MNRSRRPDPQPETRVGHCCGCHLNSNVSLFKIPGIFRYRCADCFVIETGGYAHHLAPMSSAQMVYRHLQELVKVGELPEEAAKGIRKQLTVHVIRDGVEGGLTSRDIVEQFIDPAVLRAPLGFKTGAIAVHKHMGADAAHCALCGAPATATVHS